ncbi:MAG: hypothetical protein ACRD6W_08070, partial [Nitrososphaerales archaeon]
PEGSEMCAMEAAAWLAGEPWSDHPRSVHRLVAAVAHAANDRLDDETRQSCWPLIISSIGTAHRFPVRSELALRRFARTHRDATGEELRALWATLVVYCNSDTARWSRPRSAERSSDKATLLRFLEQS